MPNFPSSALVLLTCTLLVVTGCKKDPLEESRASPEGQSARILDQADPFPQDPGTLEIETWYAIHLQGKPAGTGSVRITRHASPRGPRRLVAYEQKLVMRRGSKRVEILTVDRSLEDEQGQLLRLWHQERQTGGEEVVVEAGKLGDEMVTVRGPEVSRSAFEPGALGSHWPYRFLFSSKAAAKGDVKTFRTYSSYTGTYTDNQLKVVEVSSTQPAVITAAHTVEALPGVSTSLKLDQHNLPLEMQTSVGALTLRFVRLEEKPESGQSPEGPDLFPLTLVKTDVRFSDRQAVKWVRYRIEGLPSHVSRDWLNAPGQKVAGEPASGTFILEVSRLLAPRQHAFPLPNPAKELRPYLESTALAQTQDPRIRALALEIVEGAPDAWTAARQLRAWVSDNIDGSLGMAFASAREVLAKKEGDCSEQSVLLVTLARAAGLPARCVFGLVYQDGAFGRHIWSELYVGEWRPLDAAQETDSLSAAWIRLGEFSLKLTDDKRSGIGGTLTMVSDMKVKVEKFETD